MIEYLQEFYKLRDYNKTVEVCHSTVGKAILNTSITIVFGFSILILSRLALDLIVSLDF